MTSSSLVFLNLLVAAASQVTGEAHMKTASDIQWPPGVDRERDPAAIGWVGGSMAGRIEHQP